MSLNKVTLIGNLGADPDCAYTPSGNAVANMRLATNQRWKDKQGDVHEVTEWHRLVAFGKLAELCREYLRKGRQIYAEGRLQTRQWEDRDGNKRYTTEIVLGRVEFLGSAKAPEKMVDENETQDASEHPSSFKDDNFSPPTLGE